MCCKSIGSAMLLLAILNLPNFLVGQKQEPLIKDAVKKAADIRKDLVTKDWPKPVVLEVVAAPSPRSATGVTFVKNRNIKLVFNVGRVGTSGLGDVDVYVTTDGGATWEKQCTVNLAPATKSKLPIVPPPAPPAIRQTVNVSLAREGVVFGYSLVVKSRAGLGKAPPRPGESPQVLVELDTTPPRAELYAPQPDSACSGNLLLTWNAADRNLAAEPVSLDWAEQRAGPWYVIGVKSLPNSGRYSWRVPGGTMPPQVYFRLTVRDAAGNTAVAQTQEPCNVDLTVPEISAVSVDAS